MSFPVYTPASIVSSVVCSVQERCLVLTNPFQPVWMTFYRLSINPLLLLQVKPALYFFAPWGGPLLFQPVKLVFVTGLVVFSLQTQSFAVSTGVALQWRQPLDNETCQTGLIPYLVFFLLYTLFNCFKCGLVCTILRLSDVCCSTSCAKWPCSANMVKKVRIKGS